MTTSSRPAIDSDSPMIKVRIFDRNEDSFRRRSRELELPTGRRGEEGMEGKEGRGRRGGKRKEGRGRKGGEGRKGKEGEGKEDAEEVEEEKFGFAVHHEN